MKISLVASSIRPHLWSDLVRSLVGNKVEYEIIFVGDFDVAHATLPSCVKAISTKVKPAQCYEIGFRAATGDLIHWTADDAEYEMNALDKIVLTWKSINDSKVILAFTTVEDGRDCTHWHHLVGGRKDTPAMAPFGVMDMKFLREVGGYDRRFICGQSENDLVMRAYERGARVIQTPYKVFVEHTKKHGGNGGSVFRANGQGYYSHDRSILEGSWLLNGGVSPIRLDAFEPFFEENILTRTQSHTGKWE